MGLAVLDSLSFLCEILVNNASIIFCYLVFVIATLHYLSYIGEATCVVYSRKVY